jgi:tetratricopeptide (TPR) repeat protein/O-antigen ligase
MLRRGNQNLIQGEGAGGGWAGRLEDFFGTLIKFGTPVAVILTALMFSTHFSDYRIIKTAVVHTMVPLLLGVWLVRAAVRGRLYLERLPLYLPFLVYLTVALLSLSFSHNPAKGAEVLLFQVWCILFCILVAHHFRDPTVALGVLWAVVLTGLIVAVLGLLQHSDVHLIPTATAYGRLPVSTLGNPNFVAHYMEIIIPLTIALMIIRKQPWERAALGGVLLATGSHMVLAASRAGWLALGAALVFALYVIKARVRWLRIVALAVVAVALLSPIAELALGSIYLESGESLYNSIVLFADRTWERALSSFDPGDFSISQRLLVWGDTLELIRAHPLLGVGPGNYRISLLPYRNATSQRAWSELMGMRTNVADHAHNEYLEYWSESGFFGLAAMVWLLGAMLWMGWNFLRTQSPSVTWTITLGCMMGLIATLGHSFFSFNLRDPTSASHFWLLGGLMIAVARPGQTAQNLVLDLYLRTAWRRGLVAVSGVAVGCLGLYLGLCILLGEFNYFQGVKKYRIDKHSNRATLELREAIKWRGYNFEYHHLLGAVSLEAGRYAEAEAALKRSLELHPHNPRTLRLLGRTRYSLKKEEEAIAALKRAAEIDPLEQKTYELLGLVYRQQGAYDKAIEAWKQALSFQPEDARLLNSLGVEYHNGGQMNSAIVVLERGGQLHPEDGFIQGNLGGFYLRAGRLEEAESALRRAIELKPEMTEWRSNLAQVYSRQNKLDEALSQAEMAVQIDPRDEVLQRLVKDLRRRLEKGE